MTEQIRQMAENQGMSVTVQLNATVNMTIADRTLLRLKLDVGGEVVLVCGKGAAQSRKQELLRTK